MLTFLVVLCAAFVLRIIISFWEIGEIRKEIKKIGGKLLWIDDIRDPFLDKEGKVPKEASEIHWVLKYHQFVDWITENGLPDIISFDHDLSDIHINKSTYKEKTGMDCAKWLVEYCMDKDLDLPQFYVHSANPVGADNINGVLNNYKKFRSGQ